MSAVRSFSPHITFTMKTARSAKEIANPKTGISATQATNATQAASARETSFQATALPSEGLSTAPSASSSDNASMMPPYHMGKNPAPGPSSVM